MSPLLAALNPEAVAQHRHGPDPRSPTPRTSGTEQDPPETSGAALCSSKIFSVENNELHLRRRSEEALGNNVVLQRYTVGHIADLFDKHHLELRAYIVLHYDPVALLSSVIELSLRDRRLTEASVYSSPRMFVVRPVTKLVPAA